MQPKIKQAAEKQKTYSLNGSDTELFAKLKELRLSFAKAENMPPYIIFHDKTLMEMAHKKPSSLEEMGKISGVGETKLKKYGKAFLEKINQKIIPAAH